MLEDVWSHVSARVVIHFSQNRGRVQKRCSKTRAALPRRAAAAPTLGSPVRPSPTCLICVYLTWRIRVQSVHLSPPTLPTTALRVIKPPDRAVHGEKRTMSVLMRRVLAATSIPARQITVMNPCYDTQSKDAKNPSDSRASLWYVHFCGPTSMDG